ncbi:MAG: M23 family metallopeptidase [Phycisphaerales bacterium]|nr:M23 family metallopeptidase [Phycisphaerales bacterium]
MKLRNHRIVANCLAGAVVISIDIQAFAANEGGVHLILPNAFNPEDCITSEERVIAQKAIDAYRQAHPERAGADTAGRLTFFPTAGRLYGDMFTTNFVDLDPTSGILDWDCTSRSYDGHNGNDTGPRSFSEQLIGVPAYAALDGVVVYAHDGEFDMNTECVGIGNAVIIDHGGDLYGYYWHFKNGSVDVLEGDTVVAGQQIAEIASSGCSTGPHLHFELRDHDWFGGSTFEPYAGTCNAVDSMWEDQEGIDRELYVEDHGVTATEFADWPDRPYRYPNDREFLLSDSHQYYWHTLHNIPATGARAFRFYRPDGTLAYEYSDTWEYPTEYREVTWGWYWNIADMHTIPGTWTVDLVVDEEVLLSMQLEMVETLDEDFNRAPADISVELTPSAPTADDVLECTVLGTLVHDDPDRDLVSYRFEWTVNGTVVRDTTIAAMRDVLQSDAAGHGDLVEVTVTPTDGLLEGGSDVAEILIPEATGACCTDNAVNCVIATQENCEYFGHTWMGKDTTCEDVVCLTTCLGDVTGDGNVSVDDLLSLIEHWGPCP